jgi:hypothetical protein
VKIIDWATVSSLLQTSLYPQYTSPLGIVGPSIQVCRLICLHHLIVPIRDVAYFFGSSLTTETRRKHGTDLFEHYLRELDFHSEIKVTKEVAWRAFANQSFHVISLLIGACSALDISDRGWELGAVMFDTAFANIVDLDAKRIVLEDIATAKKPLVPALSDDALHPVAPGEK